MCGESEYIGLVYLTAGSVEVLKLVGELAATCIGLFNRAAASNPELSAHWLGRIDCDGWMYAKFAPKTNVQVWTTFGNPPKKIELPTINGEHVGVGGDDYLVLPVLHNMPEPRVHWAMLLFRLSWSGLLPSYRSHRTMRHPTENFFRTWETDESRRLELATGQHAQLSTNSVFDRWATWDRETIATDAFFSDLGAAEHDQPAANLYAVSASALAWLRAEVESESSMSRTPSRVEHEQVEQNAVPATWLTIGDLLDKELGTTSAAERDRIRKVIERSRGGLVADDDYRDAGIGSRPRYTYRPTSAVRKLIAEA